VRLLQGHRSRPDHFGHGGAALAVWVALRRSAETQLSHSYNGFGLCDSVTNDQARDKPAVARISLPLPVARDQKRKHGGDGRSGDGAETRSAGVGRLGRVLPREGEHQVYSAQTL